MEKKRRSLLGRRAIQRGRQTQEAGFSVVEFTIAMTMTIVLMAVTIGDNPAEVGISVKVSDQQHGPPAIGGHFTAHDGLDPHFFGCLNKKDAPVQPVGIRQGQFFHPLSFSGPAKCFNGADSPAPGTVGVDIEMDKIFHAVLPYRIDASPCFSLM